MWVTKLLISPVKKKDFLPKNDQIWPKIGIFGQFGPGHAGLFGALLVGQLVVVARGLYLARHLFTLLQLLQRQRFRWLTNSQRVTWTAFTILAMFTILFQNPPPPPSHPTPVSRGPECCRSFRSISECCLQIFNIQHSISILHQTPRSVAVASRSENPIKGKLPLLFKNWTFHTQYIAILSILQYLAYSISILSIFFKVRN